MTSSSEVWSLDTPAIYGLKISARAYMQGLRLVFLVNALLSCIASWVTNGILINAVLRKTNTIMGSFKFLMVAYAVMDIIFSFVYVVACPVSLQILLVFGFNKITSTPKLGEVVVLVIFNGGIFYNSSVNVAFLVLYIVLLTSTIVFAPILFIFRYLQICKAKFFSRLQAMHMWLFLIPVLITLFYASCLVIISIPNDYDTKAVLSIVRMYTQRDTAFIAMSYLKPFPTFITEQPITGAYFVTGAYTALVAASLGVMLFCARGMVASLNKVKCLSERTYKMQHRLFRMLVAQFICPLVMIHLPFCKSCIGVAVGWGWPLVDDLLPLLFAWSPMLNAAIALVHTVDVRKCTVRLIVPSTTNASSTPLQI